MNSHRLWFGLSYLTLSLLKSLSVFLFFPFYLAIYFPLTPCLFFSVNCQTSIHPISSLTVLARIPHPNQSVLLREPWARSHKVSWLSLRMLRRHDKKTWPIFTSAPTKASETASTKTEYGVFYDCDLSFAPELQWRKTEVTKNPLHSFQQEFVLNPWYYSVIVAAGERTFHQAFIFLSFPCVMK